MGIESAAAGLANRARQRAANVAFSVVIKNVGAEQWFVGGIESEVLIVVPSFGSGRWATRSGRGQPPRGDFFVRVTSPTL